MRPLLDADPKLALTLHNLQSEFNEHQVTRLSLPALQRSRHPCAWPGAAARLQFVRS